VRCASGTTFVDLGDGDDTFHGTFGIEVRVFQFHLWGLRRGRITLTGDGASKYQNAGLSIGFWH